MQNKPINLSPASVLTPVRNAVAVPAESGTCWSTLKVLESAVQGKRSQLNTFSSPVSRGFLICPLKMRAAVTVVTLIPSPRKRIAFFAVWAIGFSFRFSFMSLAPFVNHLLLRWLSGTDRAIPRSTASFEKWDPQKVHDQFGQSKETDYQVNQLKPGLRSPRRAQSVGKL